MLVENGIIVESTSAGKSTEAPALVAKSRTAIMDDKENVNFDGRKGQKVLSEKDPRAGEWSRFRPSHGRLRARLGIARDVDDPRSVMIESRRLLDSSSSVWG